MTELDDRFPDDDDDVSLDDAVTNPDTDGVAALRDTEAEAGDEAEVDDDFDLDRTEARELGVDLDRTDGDDIRME
jgi:hypothetical protein